MPLRAISKNSFGGSMTGVQSKGMCFPPCRYSSTLSRRGYSRPAVSKAVAYHTDAYDRTSADNVRPCPTCPEEPCEPNAQYGPDRTRHYRGVLSVRLSVARLLGGPIGLVQSIR